jgi:hypothetical protein
VRIAPLLVLALTAPTLGCSLARSVLQPAPGTDAFFDEDAWTDLDAGPEDAGPDAPSDDVGMPDAPCMPRCDGNTAVTCNLGHEVRTTCSGTVCDATGAFPVCLPLVCMPDGASCSADGTTSTTCNHPGTVTTTVHCDRGCTAGACRPAVTCTEPVASMAITTSGTFQLDLCGAGNNFTDTGMHGDCPSAIANGEDVMVRLDLDRTLRVMITETDVSAARNVDPIVYLRAACGRASEIDCNDNGRSSTAMLDVVLMAGEYFVVVDSFDDATHACGMVSISASFSAP